MKGVAELQLNLRVRQVKTGGKGEKGLCISRKSGSETGAREERYWEKQWNLGSWELLSEIAYRFPFNELYGNFAYLG